MARVRSSLVTGLGLGSGSEEFVVVELTRDGPRPVYDPYGQLMTFRSGDDASRVAREMTVEGKKFQPRRVKDDKWHEREKARFASKEYKQLPWHDAVWWKAHRHIWGDHFPHVSQKNSVGLMAYTPSDAEGSADSQVPIKPGRYLERYFSSILDTHIIKDLCTVFSNVFEDNCLLFAETEDEFESLYTAGPSSCMSHPKEKYTSHIHPVRVYAAGDLQLVYMKRDGRVVARALCWPAKKIYSRVYGDAGRIEPLLQKDGWRKAPPYGARLQRILTWENKAHKSGNRAFVAPHIDDCTFVMDNGDHLLVGGGDKKLPGKSVKLTGAAGITEWVSLHCKCGREVTGSGLRGVYVSTGTTAEKWCDECIRTGAFTCGVSGNIVANSQAVEMYNGTKWWSRMFKERGFTCSGDGKNYPSDHAIHVKGPGGIDKLISQSYYKANNGHRCATCGNNTIGCDQECESRHKRLKERAEKERARLAGTYVTMGGQGAYVVGNVPWVEIK